MAIDFLGPITAGVNWLAGRDAAKTQAETGRQYGEALERNQQKAITALTGKTPFSETTQDAEGRLNVDFGPGGEAANEARRKMAVGDVARADRFNEAANQVDTFGSIGDAKDFLSRDTNRARTGFMDEIAKLTQRHRQGSTGIPDTNYLGSLAGKLAPAFRQFETANIDALNLLNKQGVADRAKIADLQNLNRPQAPAPSFTDKTPGSIAAQAIYSTPPPAPVPDMSGAVGYKAVGNYLTDIQNRDRALAATQTYNKQQEKLLNAILASRHLGDKGTGT